MEVKIGVQHAPREIVFESNDKAEDVEATVAAALHDGAMLTLTDTRGGRVVVPGNKIAYVEIGPGSERRVGFGAM